MNTNNKWILMTFALIFSLSCFFHTKALAGEKTAYQKKSAKVPPKVARTSRMRSALKNRAVYQQLQQTVDLSVLTFNTTFSEAIELVRNSTEPPLRIVVMWRDLNENANIDPDTPVQIDGVPKIRLNTGLDILLLAVSSQFAKLGYIVKDGIIIIATKDSLPVKRSTRVYDVSYLLSAPARYAFGFRPGFGRGWQTGPYMGRGQQSGQRAGRMADIIKGNIRPNRWR